MYVPILLLLVFVPIARNVVNANKLSLGYASNLVDHEKTKEWILLRKYNGKIFDAFTTYPSKTVRSHIKVS